MFLLQQPDQCLGLASAAGAAQGGAHPSRFANDPDVQALLRMEGPLPALPAQPAWYLAQPMILPQASPAAAGLSAFAVGPSGTRSTALQSPAAPMAQPCAPLALDLRGAWQQQQQQQQATFLGSPLHHYPGLGLGFASTTPAVAPAPALVPEAAAGPAAAVGTAAATLGQAASNASTELVREPGCGMDLPRLYSWKWLQ